MRNALRHIPTGQSATQRLQSWPSSLPSIYNPFHLPSAHPWPNLGPTPSSRNIFFARHPFVTLLTRDHPNLDDLQRDIWETRLNAFVDILLTPSFPSSFQRFPFPSSSRTCYPFNRHLCLVIALCWLPRFNLYPLRRISWKVEQRKARKSSRWNWRWGCVRGLIW